MIETPDPEEKATPKAVVFPDFGEREGLWPLAT